jgi:hypothetical protein
MSPVDIEFLDNDFDMYAMRRALKRTRKFLETAPSLANFTIGRYGTQVPYGDSDAGTDEFIRDFTSVSSRCICLQVAPRLRCTGARCGILVRHVPWQSQTPAMV